MAKFRKKPGVIEAFMLNERGLVTEDWFWDAVTRNDIITHCFGKHEPCPAWCEIKTPEGMMIANTGDYIIQGAHGEIYPCKADIFQKIYIEDKPKTNADRIRTMSDEELAEFLSKDLKEPCDCCQLAVFEGACTETLCDDAMIKWLQQPSKGE